MEMNGLLRRLHHSPARVRTQRSAWLYLPQSRFHRSRHGRQKTPRAKAALPRTIEIPSHDLPIPRSPSPFHYQRTKRAPTDQVLSCRAHSYLKPTQRTAKTPATARLRKQILSTNTFPLVLMTGKMRQRILRHCGQETNSGSVGCHQSMLYIGRT